MFFLPTVNDEYEEIDIHSMLCDGMEVIANSLQDFGSWGRRVSKANSSLSFRKETFRSACHDPQKYDHPVSTALF